MKFNQPCFIRKNTPELREYLRRIGYNSINNEKIDSKGEGILVSNGDPKIIDSYPKYTSWDNDFLVRYFSNRDDIVDCVTNDKLFKAIAALSDDTDYHQYFKLNNDDEWHLFEPIYGLYGEIIGKDDAFSILRKDKWHKATVKELIEYFKNK